ARSPGQSETATPAVGAIRARPSGADETGREGQPHVRWLLAAYVFGLPHTEAYGDRNDRLEPELEASNRRFVAEDRDKIRLELRRFRNGQICELSLIRE